MAHFDRRRRGEMLKAVFDVLANHSDGLPAKSALGETRKRLTLTEYEQGTCDSSGLPRFDKVVRFQTINAVQAGWMVKAKGTWTATAEGLEANQKFPDPEAFMAEAEAGYRSWSTTQPPKPAVDGETAKETPALASVTVEEAEETAFAEIAEYLAAINPYDLQKLVAGLLRGMGYHVAWVSPPGKDRGLDILAFRDPLGTEDPRIKVQVKREQSKTDVKGLRAFMSLLNPGHGVFVTLGGFTSDAESEARNSETRRLTLIDQRDLVDLWVQHYKEIPAEDQLLLPIQPVYYLATAELDAD